MRKLLLGVVAAAVAAAFLPAHARATHECALPHAKTLWIDFAEGSSPYWRTFAKPGNVVAASNFVNPAKIRALGAKTVYMDLNFRHRVGPPADPVDPALVEERAAKLYDYAAAALRCARPYIALNELFGAGTAPPWSPQNAQYRANVLLFMRTLAARGARPFLLVNSRPYTGGEAADWWREAAQYGDLVREVYFAAPSIHRQGALRGNRALRRYFRGAVEDFLQIGIPASRIGLMLGFQTRRGIGGREGLEPESAWFEVVKWQALSTRQIVSELGIASVWSWGWAAFRAEELDPDKKGAGCVWLWVRSPKLCDGPRAAGPRFNASLTHGQIDFPRSVQCMLDGRVLSSSTVARLARVTGDRDIAYGALFGRLVESGRVVLPPSRIAAAERAIVATRFGGSSAAYRDALARLGATPGLARGVIGDELRRAYLESSLAVPYPSGPDVSEYYESYASLPARVVEAKPAPWWLNGRTRGLALASSAPFAVFRLDPGQRADVWTPGGVVRVRALGQPRPLSTFDLVAARPAIVASLRASARADSYDRRALARRSRALGRIACARDEFPAASAVDLTEYLPFLELR